MSKQGLTEIVCIIDHSGSMEPLKSDAIGGFNSFLDEQKKIPGNANFTLVLFNHDYHLCQSGVNLADVKPLDSSSYVPCGTTALLDAIGRTLDDVGKRLSETKEDDRPGKVIVAILTDGLENASKDYTREKIFQIIKQQRETYKWEFFFLAANQDAIQGAMNLSIDPQNAVKYANTSMGTRSAYTSMSNAILQSRTQS